MEIGLPIEGTWTIYNEFIHDSINIEFTRKFIGNTTIVTIEGAANENIYIDDEFIGTTNSNGEILEYEITTGIHNIRGTVSNYESSINVNLDDERVYAMPEGSVYWYGNLCYWNSGGWSISGWNTTIPKYNIKEPTYNLNSAYLQSPDMYFSLMAMVNPVNTNNFQNYSKVNISIGNTTTQYVTFGLNNNKTLQSERFSYNVNINKANSDFSLEFAPTEINKYLGVLTQNGNRFTNVKAIWFE